MTPQKRVALIIGNSNYDDGKRVSGVENAKAIDICLSDLGFEDKELILDATLDDMNKALIRFQAKVRGASAALFYYSGHGFQVLDKNYLLPKEGDIVPARSMAVNQVLQSLDSGPGVVKLVILDACRDRRNPSTTAFAEAEPAPAGVYQAFSASPGQLAQSGSAEELSPYTMALLQNIREPGLELIDFFDRVRDDVRASSSGQFPVEAGDPPQNFYFRPPVEVQLKTFGWPYSRLLVFRNGELVLPKENQAQSSEESLVVDIPLKARGNELVLMVSNGKTYHNGQVWGRTESWSYKLDLRFPVKNVPEGHTITFEGREDVPFKDGPHHGQTFIVANATLFVDPLTADVTLPSPDTGPPNPDTTIAFRATPFWAQDQEILYWAKLADLKIPPDEVLGGVIDPDLFPLIRPFLSSLLTTGKILDKMIVDPEKVFVAVRGNRALKGVAEHCMTTLLQNRFRDLRESFASFFNDRNPRPFDVYVDGLNADIRANAASFGILLPSRDLRVWTSLDDPSAVVPVSESLPSRSRDEISEAMLLALEQESILTRRPGEAMIRNGASEQFVRGVPLRVPVYTFLKVEPVGAVLQLHARVVADLTDLQVKIGPLIDTIPLPTQTCARFAGDNIVARIWGKELSIDGNTATLKLNGDAEMWFCAKDVPCSKVEWDGLIPRVVFWDCRPPINRRVLNQPFGATLPLAVERVDDQSFAVRIGEPAIDLGGALGDLSEKILELVGVDINTKAKEALEQAISPDTLKQKLPDFVLKYNPTLVQAQLLSNAGALALQWDLDATLNISQLGELLQDLLSHHLSA